MFSSCKWLTAFLKITVSKYTILEQVHIDKGFCYKRDLGEKGSSCLGVDIYFRKHNLTRYQIILHNVDAVGWLKSYHVCYSGTMKKGHDIRSRWFKK